MSHINPQHDGDNEIPEDFIDKESKEQMEGEARSDEERGN